MLFHITLKLVPRLCPSILCSHLDLFLGLDRLPDIGHDHDKQSISLHQISIVPFLKWRIFNTATLLWNTQRGIVDPEMLSSYGGRHVNLLCYFINHPYLTLRLTLFIHALSLGITTKGGHV